MNTTTLRTLFQEFIAEKGYEEDSIRPIPGGEVVVNNDVTEAVVWIDGRFPTLEEGYQVNEYITETITVHHGSIIIHTDGEKFTLGEGETFAILPNTPYAITGQAVCVDNINPPWDSTQKKYIKL
jgi:mannose-6-phosphate isomerase-like protein (cupin superfamily)